jgi:hypothetical protein
MDLQGIGWVASTGLFWLRTGTIGGHGIEPLVSINAGISWLVEVLLASHEELCCVELVVNVSYYTPV